MDKSAAILSACERGPHSLEELAAATRLPRPTAHRLAVALEGHGLVARDDAGRFRLGPRIVELAAAADSDALVAQAGPVLRRLRDTTGESAQLYRRHGDRRICVAVADRETGLRDTVPLGASLTMAAGSAAQVLLAWDEPATVDLRDTAFSARKLAAARRQGWAASVGEREPGVASVSAPVRSGSGRVIAAVSLSGPVERFGADPGRDFADAVVAAATELSASAR